MKINANFELLQLRLNNARIAVPFQGESTDSSEVLLTASDVDPSGFRLEDGTATLFKAFVVGFQETSSEVVMYEMTFGVVVKDEIATLISQPTVFSYHEDVSPWELLGVEIDGLDIWIKVKAEAGVKWVAHISSSTVFTD